MATTSKITLTNGKGGVKTVAEPAYLRMQKMLERQGWFPVDGPIKPKPVVNGKSGPQSTTLKQPPFTPKEVIDMRAKKEEAKKEEPLAGGSDEVVKEPAPMANMKEVPFDVSPNGAKPMEVVTKLNPDGTPAQTQASPTSKKK